MVTSAEEQAIREQVGEWARGRWGADVRVIDELVLGARRVDRLLVYPHDLIGVEIKGPRDSLADGRLAEQIQEFSYYLPEVWLVVAERWADHPQVHAAGPYCNVAVATPGGIVVDKRLRDRRNARRDDLCCSRLLELLWVSETVAVARRTNCAHEYAPGKLMPTRRIKSMLARMLTGHEIVREVCAELRSRPLVGQGSDDRLGRGENAAGQLPGAAARPINRATRPWPNQPSDESPR